MAVAMGAGRAASASAPAWERRGSGVGVRDCRGAGATGRRGKCAWVCVSYCQRQELPKEGRGEILRQNVRLLSSAEL
jgi:hypothetical protein